MSAPSFFPIAEPVSLLEYVSSPEYAFAIWSWKEYAPWQKEMPSLNKDRRIEENRMRKLDMNEALKK